MKRSRAKSSAGHRGEFAAPSTPARAATPVHSAAVVDAGERPRAPPAPAAHCGVRRPREAAVTKSATVPGHVVPVTTPYYREKHASSGDPEAGTIVPRLGGAGHLRPVHAEAASMQAARSPCSSLAGSAWVIVSAREGIALDIKTVRSTAGATLDAGPSGPAQRGAAACCRCR